MCKVTYYFRHEAYPEVKISCKREKLALPAITSATLGAQLAWLAPYPLHDRCDDFRRSWRAISISGMDLGWRVPSDTWSRAL